MPEWWFKSSASRGAAVQAEKFDTFPTQILGGREGGRLSRPGFSEIGE